MPRSAGASSERVDTTAPSSTSVLTQAQKILVSFHRVSGGATRKVPYEELVLQAWRDFPEEFSLRNHPEHPDASDIHKKLYAGLKTDGFILSLGNKMFRLTEKGVAEAADLSAVEENAPKLTHDKARLNRDDMTFLIRARGSRTFVAWRSGRGEQLIEYDARMFFQFSTGSPVKERALRVKFAKDAIRKARAIGEADAEDLEALADFLADRFSMLYKES